MRIPLIFVTISLFMMTYAACGTKGSGTTPGPTSAATASTPTPSSGPSGPTIAPDVPFSFEITGDNKDQFNLHRVSTTTSSGTTAVTATDFDQPCVAAKGEIATCIVDAEEWTFYAQDLNLHYTVPSKLCDYIMLEPFYFVNHKTAYYSPTDTINVYIDKAGSIGKHYNVGTDLIDQPLDCYAEGAEPTCCVGKYNQIFSSYSLTTGWSTPSLSTVNRPLGTCLGGPASITEGRDPLGFIVPKFQFVAATGFSSDYKIPGTTNQLVDIAWSTNYFEAADHVGGIPSSFKYNPGHGITLGNPYYSLSCYDRSWELNSQIRIQLRDWNTKAEYDNRRVNPNAHDTVGNEPTPNGSKPINDQLDWKDLEAAGRVIPDFSIK